MCFSQYSIHARACHVHVFPSSLFVFLLFHFLTFVCFVLFVIIIYGRHAVCRTGETRKTDIHTHTQCALSETFARVRFPPIVTIAAETYLLLICRRPITTPRTLTRFRVRRTHTPTRTIIYKLYDNKCISILRVTVAVVCRV